MKDRRRPSAPPATTPITEQKRNRYPHTTGLPAWTVALITQLKAARGQLHPSEYDVLLDCLAIAVARETTGRLLTVDDLERRAA